MFFTYINTLLTPTASAAAFGHRKMQAFFCDSHFARFFHPFGLRNLCKFFNYKKTQSISWNAFSLRPNLILYTSN